MKQAALAFIIGWFFTVQSPWPGDPAGKAQIVQTVGPFLNKAQCSAQRDEVIEMISAIGLQGEVKPCVEREGA